MLGTSCKRQATPFLKHALDERTLETKLTRVELTNTKEQLCHPDSNPLTRWLYLPTVLRIVDLEIA